TRRACRRRWRALRSGSPAGGRRHRRRVRPRRIAATPRRSAARRSPARIPRAAPARPRSAAPTRTGAGHRPGLPRRR
ncbi:MAG: hypothetical protein E6G16_08460, partial [Actinobacteria bacterium]